MKRSGLAVTDLQRIIASPLDVVETGKLVVFLEDYFRREPVDDLVLGEPRDLLGRDTHMSAKVREIYGLLRKKFPQVAVHLVDERFTSKIAQDAMIRGGMKKKERRKKENVDLISATLILQSFLEQQSR